MKGPDSSGRDRAIDGDLGHFTAYAQYLRESGAETRGMADFYDALSNQRTETIAKSLSRLGSLDTLIRSLSDAEILRLLTRLADLFADLEERRQFESAALISTAQDRVQEEYRSRRR